MIVSSISVIRIPSAHSPRRSHLPMGSEDVAAQLSTLIAIAPTTPIAYSSPSALGSALTASTSIGATHATSSPTHGTPE